MNAGTSTPRGADLDFSAVAQEVGGYKSLYAGRVEAAPDTTTDSYAKAQAEVNAGKVLEYVLPRARELGARSLLDVGCGIGAMVKTFLDQGYEAYGADLPGLHRHWKQLGLSAESMFIVCPDELRLPFRDGGIDFAYSFGVIEHVGTSDGMADRLADFHQRRRQWLREIYRTIRPGGAMLICGPNRRFPIDVAHGPDSRASSAERWLSAKLRVSVHKTWGEHFLWSYDDFAAYLDGLTYRLEPQSVSGFLALSRVPGPLRKIAHFYIDHLPTGLLNTGLNPWVMALVHKPQGHAS
jgi:SAM-dependent methyltransferase